MRYKIVRKFKNDDADYLVYWGLTLEEAQNHCSQPYTSNDVWMEVFYGYEEVEDEDDR